MARSRDLGMNPRSLARLAGAHITDDRGEGAVGLGSIRRNMHDRPREPQITRLVLKVEQNCGSWDRGLNLHTIPADREEALWRGAKTRD